MTVSPEKSLVIVVVKMKSVHVAQKRRLVSAVYQKRRNNLLKKLNMSNFDDYHSAVRFIENFSNSSIRKNFGKDKIDPGFFLERTKYFLNLIGNPERGNLAVGNVVKPFSFIHVTGTAGKGTVSTMLQNVLVASGKKTGLFTSPYVTTTIEKIKVNDKYISPEVFVELVEYIKPYIEMARQSRFGSPSAFELFFIIALLYFRKEKCEWVVLEVGLGGRYDATNVITNPVTTVITNIDYDHTEVLGKTLREIATDKSGIIKKGSQFFTSEQRLQLQKLFRNTCKKVGAKFNAIPRQRMYSDYNRELVKVVINSLQVARGNSALLKILPKNIDQIINQTKLPCRFEVVQEKPLIILDGAHNRAKIRSTVSNLKVLCEDKFKVITKSKYAGVVKSKFTGKIFIILTIADTNKDKQAVLEPIFKLSYPIHAIFTHVKSNERRSVHPNLLAKLAKSLKKKSDSIEIIEDPHEALESVIDRTRSGDIILVTGSFFLAGELRKKWFSEEWVLRNRKSFK